MSAGRKFVPGSTPAPAHGAAGKGPDLFQALGSYSGRHSRCFLRGTLSPLRFAHPLKTNSHSRVATHSHTGVLAITAALFCGCLVDATEASGGTGGSASSSGAADPGGGGAINGGSDSSTSSSSAGTGGLSTGGASSGGGGEGAGLPQGEPCSAQGADGVCVDVEVCAEAGFTSIPGFCPGPSEIQCCVDNPVSPGSCDPDAMPTPNVNVAEAPGESTCLPGMTLVSSFCVDTFEAHLVTFPDLEPMSPYFNPGNTEVMARSAEGAVPHGYINQLEAEDACTNAGKRLCTNQEWLRACRGPTNTTYPYGNTLDLGVCNDHRDQHPAIEYFMTTEDWIWSELGHQCLNQLEDGLAQTGAYSQCTTSEGVHDMMGNLHEWTDDPAGTFRGGFYVDTVVNGPGCLYATTAHDVSHWDYSTGFRCCADP